MLTPVDLGKPPSPRLLGRRLGDPGPAVFPGKSFLLAEPRNRPVGHDGGESRNTQFSCLFNHQVQALVLEEEPSRGEFVRREGLHASCRLSKPTVSRQYRFYYRAVLGFPQDGAESLTRAKAVERARAR